MRVGIMGYGRMGAAMGARFAAQGHQLIVWNRSAEPRAAALAAGAQVVETPAEVAQASDVVLSSLFDETAVRSVYLGTAGIASATLNGRLVIDTSTVPPRLAPALAHAVSSAGGRFVDAPVLGTVGPAREGRLIALLGGASSAVAEAAVILRSVARAVHPMGGAGAGYAAKLAINLLKGTYWAALGDCLCLAKRFGIDQNAILDVIESGPGALVELAGKMPVLRGAITGPAFDIDGGLKDLQVIVAAGGGGEAVPVASSALEAVSRAVKGGWGKRDIAAVALYAAAQMRAND
jgi:3-hydroxyisobutyrate dehydrogenase